MLHSATLLVTESILSIAGLQWLDGYSRVGFTSGVAPVMTGCLLQNSRSVYKTFAPECRFTNSGIQAWISSGGIYVPEFKISSYSLDPQSETLCVAEHMLQRALSIMVATENWNGVSVFVGCMLQSDGYWIQLLSSRVLVSCKSQNVNSVVAVHLLQNVWSVMT